jgi:hypothetical protein
MSDTVKLERRLGITELKLRMRTGYIISIGSDNEHGEKKRQCELRIATMDIG